MNRRKTLDLVEAELSMARTTRAEGNEGMARVCSRRAAGWAAGYYFELQYGHDADPNAYRQLKKLGTFEEVSEAIRQAARRLTTRITLDHQLPHPEDPIEDAEFIVAELMPEE